MDELTGDRLVEVAQVWALATDDEVDDSLLDSIRDHGSIEWLGDTPDEVLLEAALIARKPGERRTWTLPLREWERAVHAINLTAAGSSLRPGAFEHALLPHFKPASPMDIAAIRLLEARAIDRSIHGYLGERGRHRRLPVADVPGLSQVDANEVETAAAMLLVQVAPTGSFSSTGTGQVFIDSHTGYHLEGERTCITGLSAGLDHARDCMDGHRLHYWPPGGAVQRRLARQGDLRAVPPARRHDHFPRRVPPAVAMPRPSTRLGPTMTDAMQSPMAGSNHYRGVVPTAAAGSSGQPPLEVLLADEGRAGRTSALADGSRG